VGTIPPTVITSLLKAMVHVSHVLSSINVILLVSKAKNFDGSRSQQSEPIPTALRCEVTIKHNRGQTFTPSLLKVTSTVAATPPTNKPHLYKLLMFSFVVTVFFFQLNTLLSKNSLVNLLKQINFYVVIHMHIELNVKDPKMYTYMQNLMSALR
jgi:hypothetical protein